MSRKDFELIAATFLDIAGEIQPSEELFRTFMARRMAEALATTNPLFDRGRFLKACGV